MYEGTNMGRSLKPVKIFTAVLMIVVTAFVYCADVSATGKEEKVNISLIGKYDSSDTAAIRAIDTENRSIRFRNHSTGKTYTLKYDNTSMMYDHRGTPMSARLLEEGQIVDVNFLKSSKHVTSLKISDKAWAIDDTRNHDLVRGDGTARIQGEMYRIDPGTLILADGEPAIAEEVLTTDNIKAYGIGKEIYSIVVTSGHGYVSLSSDTVEDHSLVGSWLELDNEVIYKISPNMFLSAPEGEYELQILGNGAEYKSTVNISRNKETVVNTEKVTITKPKEGLVTFEIIPEDAEVYVDGEKVLTGTSQLVSYGYHNLKVMADGYITQHKYLKVGTAKSVIKIELEPEYDGGDSSSSSVSDSAALASSKDKKDKASSAVSVATLPGKSSAATSASSSEDKNKKKQQVNKAIEGYKIYADKPAGVELYFDGNYIGVTPIGFQKVSGSHEIILRKEGYKTKSYRVNIDSAENDVSYGFDDMVKEQTESEPKEKEKSSEAGSTITDTKKPSESVVSDTSGKTEPTGLEAEEDSNSDGKNPNTGSSGKTTDTGSSGKTTDTASAEKSTDNASDDSTDGTTNESTDKKTGKSTGNKTNEDDSNTGSIKEESETTDSGTASGSKEKTSNL